MSADLLTIHPEPPIHPDVIARLTTICEMVQNDKCSAVAIATLNRDGSVSTCWSPCSNIPALVGGIERLKYRILQSMHE